MDITPMIKTIERVKEAAKDPTKPNAIPDAEAAIYSWHLQKIITTEQRDQLLQLLNEKPPRS